MAEFDLPAGPAELFAAVRETLGEYLGGQRHMRLGGGTALAARWAHRHSTDVDIFVPAAQYALLYQRRDSFHRAAARRLAPSAVTTEEGLLTLLLRQRDRIGEITVANTQALTPVPHSVDTVRGTPVPLETNAEILAKKLRYRMIVRQLLVPRDFYDLAVASDRDPRALKQALALIDSFNLQELYHRLDGLPDRWMANHRQQLINPAHHRPASSAVSIVKHVIADTLRSRPPSAGPRRDIAWDR